MQHIPGTHYALRGLLGGHGEHRPTTPKPRWIDPPRAPETAPVREPEPPRREPVPEPVNLSSTDPLRPSTLETMIGQERLKPLLRRIIDTSRRSGRPLDHVLLQGASGTGKSTLALVIASELRTRMFMVKPPVSLTMFERLREVMHDRDVLYLDEIHLQVSGDRRGVGQAPDPETFYHVMEDRKLITLNGPVPFPAVTIIGATTDSGLLPEPFLGRFALAPRLDPYTVDEMALMARVSSKALGMRIDVEGAFIFARACRGNPRVLNGYLRNARMLAPSAAIDLAVAREVVVDLNDATLDGLTPGMVAMLRYLLRSPRTIKGETQYVASVNAIATALGHSRDTKAVSLYVEPYLIEQGYVTIAHNGRRLTDAGIARASAL